MLKKRRVTFFFLLPGAALLAVIVGYSVITLFVNSVFQFNFADPTIPRKFVGLQNYVTLFKDVRFWVTSRNTALFTTIAVSVEFFVGLSIALLLNRQIKAKKVIIALLILPTMMMPVAVGFMGRYMYNSEYGIISYMLRQIGLLGPRSLLGNKVLLTHPLLAFLCIVATDIWEWTPFVSLILLAGLAALPREPFEAARVDGASGWQTFRFITFPMLAPVISVALLIRIVDAVRVLDIVYVITGGGPGMTTETAHLFAYKINFKNFNMGYGSSQVVTLTIIVIAICVFLFRQIEKEGI